jgi:hypothetical protein
LTFSWSSSSWLSLFLGFLLLGSSFLFLGCWLLGSLFFLFLLSGFSVLSTFSFIGFVGFSGLLLDFNLQVAGDLIVEIFSESALQHLGGLVIDVDFTDLDFGLFGDPIQSSFSLFLLDFERDTLDRTSLNSFD